MWIELRVSFLAVAIVLLSALAHAENWIDFHTEKWSRKSSKTGKKLLFKNHYLYDAESMVRTASNDITLWIQEISDNDRYYVNKGAPQSETVFRKVHVWCTLKRYEVLQADTFEEGANELLSEEIKVGSYYERLHETVCKTNSL
jgi:hypothetical protein